jgi:hypothetical protein
LGVTRRTVRPSSLGRFLLAVLGVLVALLVLWIWRRSGSEATFIIVLLGSAAGISLLAAFVASDRACERVANGFGTVLQLLTLGAWR